MFSALRSAKVVVVASRSLHTLSHELQPSKILCIGRNYIDHVKELNNAIPAEPVIFMKPPSALLANGKNILLPHFSSDVHHEAELVVMVGTKTTPRDAPSEADALNIVYGYAAGLDMTARDVQNKLKAQGLPWTFAKCWDTSAPVGDFVRASEIPDVQSLEIILRVNGRKVQHGNTQLMLRSVAQIVAFCARSFTLLPGDLIFTGTPAGVGPVKAGDKLEVEITSLPKLTVGVEA
eukprot:c10581_g1_i2.p1 GENE.c10581_g1_i2~~c10581_g1_i2.p1  ORF type:complete len:243 (-),score=71.93 c10581_g1_i2:84-788(-)